MYVQPLMVHTIPVIKWFNLSRLTHIHANTVRKVAQTSHMTGTLTGNVEEAAEATDLIIATWKQRH